MPKWDEDKHRPIVKKTDTGLAVKRFTPKSGDSVYVLAAGITDRYRAVAIICLVIPKLVIAAATLFYAAGYVLYAETVEGIVNSQSRVHALPSPPLSEFLTSPLSVARQVSS